MTVLESLQGMVSTFNPASAKGVNTVVQLNASGEGGGSYQIKIEEGKATVLDSVAESPAVTINTSAQDWLSIIEGKLDPTKAFMTGKLKIAGDLGLMMRFQRMFMPS